MSTTVFYGLRAGGVDLAPDDENNRGDPRAIAAVEAADAEFFGPVPTEAAIALLTRLVGEEI